MIEVFLIKWSMRRWSWNHSEKKYKLSIGVLQVLINKLAAEWLKNRTPVPYFQGSIPPLKQDLNERSWCNIMIF